MHASGTSDSSGGPLTIATNASSPEVLERDPTDRDDDRPGSRNDPDSDQRLTFGRAAGAAEAAAIASLIRHYYALAARRQTRSACALVALPLIESLGEHGSAEGGVSSATVCVRAAARLFDKRHREIVEDLGAIEPLQVRVRERRGLMLARMARVRERLIPVRREAGGWRMETLLDDGSP